MKAIKKENGDFWTLSILLFIIKEHLLKKEVLIMTEMKKTIYPPCFNRIKNADSTN